MASSECTCIIVSYESCVGSVYPFPLPFLIVASYYIPPTVVLIHNIPGMI